MNKDGHIIESEYIRRMQWNNDVLSVTDSIKYEMADKQQEIILEHFDADMSDFREYMHDKSKWEQKQCETMPRWIPVTERLPVGGDSGDICENVCLMLDDGTVSCGWMNGITKKVYFLNARDDFIIRAPITRVTHWMPLPEPPKEVKWEE